MSLRKDIEKLTAPSSGGKTNVKFRPLDGPSRKQKDVEMNNRPVRLRNNRKFYEEALVPENEKIESEYDEQCLDEIRASVREVNGGEISNTRLEQHIKWRQEEAKQQQKLLKSTSSESSGYASTLSSMASTSTFPSSETPEEDLTTDMLQDNLGSNKLYKNGVIRGLLNKNIITLADLSIYDDPRTVIETNEPDSRVNLVQHPDDPDLLVHPLQAYEKLQYTRDFVLDRIGTKKIMTPRNCLLNVDDSDFDFVKKSA